MQQAAELAHGWYTEKGSKAGDCLPLPISCLATPEFPGLASPCLTSSELLHETEHASHPLQCHSTEADRVSLLPQIGHVGQEQGREEEKILESFMYSEDDPTPTSSSTFLAQPH